MALLPGGGYAEYVSVHHGHVMRVPRGLTMVQAAALPEVWLTAYQLLHMTADLGHHAAEHGDGAADQGSGLHVLVHAGGSGVGTAAVQLVKLAGAKSYVTAGSQHKIDTAISLGASQGSNYKTGAYVSLCLYLTQNFS